MGFKTIDLRIENAVAWVILNRPEALNALSLATLGELTAAIDFIEAESTVRVVVLTGHGRAFCAGADLGGVADAAANPTGPSFLQIVQATLNRVRALPMPVIASLNGITMGGGLELAMCADFIVASETARIADAHSNVGVIPGAGGCALLPRLISPAFAKYMVFSGDVVSATDLQRLGLIAKVFPLAELDAGTRALAERLAAKSPLALRHSKRIIDQGLMESDVQVALGMEVAANDAYGATADFAEGLKAFAEKRPPVFIGC